MHVASDHSSTASDSSKLNSPEGEESPILVVDDSEVSRLLARQIITRGTGRDVIAVESSRLALDILSETAIAAVVTDLQMPGMDGLELVENIRIRYPGIPVILMTAYGSEIVAMNALKAGAANYVPKKCLAKNLVRILNQVFAVVDEGTKRRKLIASQTERVSRFEVENDPLLLAPLIIRLQDELAAFGIGDETARMRIGVALQESLANALFHGNLECSSDLRQEDERVFYRLADQRRMLEPFCSRRIRVESDVNRDRAEITIRDDGPGFDITSMDKPFDPEDLLKIGGRGMLLIRTFTDEVRHNAAGNQITLIKRR